MTDISRILVPADGSDGALHEAELAGNLPVGGADNSSSVEKARSSFEKYAHENELPATAEALGKLAKEPDAVVTWGHSSEELCRYANNHSVDLTVIGLHGRTGLKRAFLSSVSQAVANQASCPVTRVK